MQIEREIKREREMKRESERGENTAHALDVVQQTMSTCFIDLFGAEKETQRMKESTCKKRVV